MKITETQIAHVNKQIEALISADSFYGKKLHEAGISKISSAEDFSETVKTTAKEKDIQLISGPEFIRMLLRTLKKS